MFTIASTVGPCTLKAALKQYYDITSPARKNLCAILAQYAQNEEERKRLLILASDDPDEQTEYRKWIVDDLRYSPHSSPFHLCL